ncbi:hypothetical protein V9T40_006538 [Parthenolecanium corni]|uniref:Uncharacterized protein n=1 Tax=Parthenolecanium corni TaxID=536013 RepID=A0AAN9TMW4_9HEMI
MDLRVSEVSILSSLGLEAEDPTASQGSDLSHFGRLVIDMSVPCEAAGLSAFDHEEDNTMFCEVGSPVGIEVGTANPLSDGEEEEVARTIHSNPILMTH